MPVAWPTRLSAGSDSLVAMCWREKPLETNSYASTLPVASIAARERRPHARRAECRGQVALLHGLFALHDLGSPDVLVQLIHRRECAVERMPVDLQPLRGAHRVPLARRDHRDEVLLAHDARAAERLDRGLVHALYFARRSRRPDDPRVQHALDAHVGDELVGAVHLPSDVAAREGLADHPVLRRRLGPGLDLDVHEIADLLA